MVSGVGVFDACGRYAHTFQAEHDMHLAALDRGAVFGADDIRGGAFGCGGAGHILRQGRLRKESAGGDQGKGDFCDGAKRSHRMKE